VNIKSKILQLLGIDSFLDNIWEVIEARVELFKMQIQEQIVRLAVRIVPLIIMLIIASGFLLLASISIGFLLSERLESHFYGFGIVALFYLILTIIMAWIYRSKEWQRKLSDRILKELTDH
jgi:hypothetical protein